MGFAAKHSLTHPTTPNSVDFLLSPQLSLNQTLLIHPLLWNAGYVRFGSDLATSLCYVLGQCSTCYPGVQMGTGKEYGGVTLYWTKYLIQGKGEENYS